MSGPQGGDDGKWEGGLRVRAARGGDLAGLSALEAAACRVPWTPRARFARLSSGPAFTSWSRNAMRCALETRCRSASLAPVGPATRQRFA